MQTTEQKYPNIDAWVQDGWIEIGYTDYVDSFIRVLNEGGTIWEGEEHYESLDSALMAADTAVADWLGVHAPDVAINTNAQPTFTPKQGQYLAFIHNYTMLHGQAPSESEMRRFFDVTPPSVHGMVIRLEEAGLISRVPGRPRSIRLLVSVESLPVLER